MPYLPPIPPTTLGQAIAVPIVVTSSGATTIAGSTFDPTQPLANIAIQLNTIASALNGGTGGTVETKIPGGLLNTLNSSAKSLANIDGALQVMITGGKEAVGTQFSAAHSIQSSLSTIASLMTTMISLQSLAAADQINHNLFTQQTTNQGREEAQLKPIEVKAEAFTKQTQGTFAKIATINSQTSASGLLLEISTGALKGGLDITKDLIAGTAVGQTFMGWGKDVKAYVATQQDAIKAKAKETQAELERKKLAAASGTP
jgi:hypothetical protein